MIFAELDYACGYDEVHDELVAEVTADEKEAVSKLLKETMESVVSLRVPLVADVNEGKNWAETK